MVHNNSESSGIFGKNNKKISLTKEEARNIFYENCIEKFNSEIVKSMHEHTEGYMIYDKYMYGQGKKQAFFSGSPDLKVGVGGKKYIEGDISLKARPKDTFDKHYDNKLHAIETRKKMYDSEVFNAFKNKTLADRKSMMNEICKEIIDAVGEAIIDRLDVKNNKKLADYIVNKMLAYIGSGCELGNTLEDNLRIGIFRDVEPVYFTANDPLHEKDHLVLDGSKTKLNIQSLLRNYMDYGEYSDKIILYNKEILADHIFPKPTFR